VKSFDQSLKYLLHKEPVDFIRFGLGDGTVQLVEPIPSDLPSRGRDVDGGYRIERGGEELAAHVEFHRRHQKLEDLAVDVAEAQVRLYRRERVPVVSLVWDLYGQRTEPLLQERTLDYGAAGLEIASRAVYVRVNLRALRAAELLASAPPAMWPLIALTQDGADEEGVRRAYEAIEARTDLLPAERADHLAVLWFVAEAEDVPVQAMRVYISEERLMESGLYKSIFEKGEARGRVEGRVETLAKVLVRGLMHHLGTLDPVVRERIRSEKDAETLDVWCEELPAIRDVEGAQRLVNKIMNATAR
jgi:predicted transposase YdaD